jgi:hypothetical protein
VCAHPSASSGQASRVGDVDFSSGTILCVNRSIAREEQTFSLVLRDSLAFVKAQANRLQGTSTNAMAAFDPVEGEDAEPVESEPVGYILPPLRRQFEGRLARSSQSWFQNRSGWCFRTGIRQSDTGFRWRRCRLLRRTI